jgi:hypothetical protein
MHPVAIEFGGQVGAIVHDERDTARLRDRLQHAGGAPDRVVIDVLQAQLQTGDIAARQRLFKIPGEPVRIKDGWRNQVEPGGRRRFDPENSSVLP